MTAPVHHTTSSLRVALLLTASNGFLDVFTFLQYGAFATAQTGNVILLFVGLVRPGFGRPVEHLWPILSFVVGVLLANVLKTPSIAERLHYSARYALGLQILLLVVVSILPASTPTVVITVLLAGGAGLQLGLFRLVRSNAYITIATTGNLMRLTEFSFTAIRTRRAEDISMARVYAAIITAFIAGAVVGALLTDAWGKAASWVVAGVVAAALAMFFVDDYREHRILPEAEPVEDDLTG